MKSDAVATVLRREIMDGTIPAGTRLRQVEVADRLGVSTTPVREAFVALSRERIVVNDDHRSVVVFSPTFDDVREAYLIRTELECLAIEKAVPLMTQDDHEDLARIVRAMAKANLDARVDLNRQFHRRLYEPAGLPRLFGLIEELRDASIAYVRLIVRQAPLQDHQVAHAEHEAILDACLQRDATEAALLVAQHLTFTADLIRRALPSSQQLND